MSATIRKTIIYLLFLGLAGGMLWYLYKDISWERDLKPSLVTANWALIALSFGIGYSATIMRGLRWNIMLEPMGYKADRWTLVHSVAFGYCMNNLIPRSGELARCTLLNRAERVPVDKLIGTVILERIVDMLLLCAVMLLAFLLHTEALNNLLTPAPTDASAPQEKSYLLYYLGIAAIVGLLLLWLLFKYFQSTPIVKRAFEFLRGIGEGVKTITKLRQQGLFWLYSVGIWAAWLLMAYCSMKALKDTSHMSLADTLFFMAAGSLGMIVPTPGGAGAFHGMSVLAFQALGYKGDVGKIYAMISWSLKTAFDIMVGAIGFIIVTSKKVKI